MNFDGVKIWLPPSFGRRFSTDFRPALPPAGGSVLAASQSDLLAYSVVARPTQGPQVVPLQAQLRMRLVGLDVVGDIARGVVAVLTYRITLAVVSAQLLPALGLVEAV